VSEFPEAVEATPEESRRIAYQYIERAIDELDSLPPDSHTVAHVRAYLTSAMIWIRP
jgi:hypothetical protein